MNKSAKLAPSATQRQIVDSVNMLDERAPTDAAPASAASPGRKGSWAWDGDYVYVAVDENTWKRAALSTW